MIESKHGVRSIGLAAFLIALFFTTIVGGVLMTYRSIAQSSQGIFLEDYPATATYVVKMSGDYVWAVRYDGKIVTNGTDARTVIQYAIDSVGSNGGTVFIKRGTYNLNHTSLVLYVQSKVKLIGEGYENTILRQIGSAGGAVALYPNYTEVRDLSLLGKGYGAGVGTSWRPRGCKVLNCRIANWTEGIYFAAGPQNEFRGNIIEDCSHGIVFGGGSDSVISGNIISEISGGGISINSCQNIVVSQNVIRNWGKSSNDAGAIVVTNYGSSSENINIVSNTAIGGNFSTSHFGVYLAAASGAYYIRRCSIVGNTLSAVPGINKVGVYLHEYSFMHNVQDITISSNTVSGFGSGYQFASGEAINMIGNVAKNVWVGVWSASPYKTKIMSNILIGASNGTNDWDGIRLNGANRVDVIGNFISNFYCGITEAYPNYADGDYDNIQMNRIENVGAGGAIEKVGTHTIVENNLGFTTENSGTAILRAGTTSVSFTHGLAGTPQVVAYSWKGDIGGSYTLGLYVNSFDNAKTGWTKVGSSPYLDAADYPSNYVRTKTNGTSTGDYGFADSGRTVETIKSVKLGIYCRYESSGDEIIQPFIYDGVSWTRIPDVAPPSGTAWAYWILVDVSSIVNSWTKIDNAKLYIVYRQVGAANSNVFVDVDACKLIVDYSTGPPVQSCWSANSTHITVSTNQPASSNCQFSWYAKYDQ